MYPGTVGLNSNATSCVVVLEPPGAPLNACFFNDPLLSDVGPNKINCVPSLTAMPIASNPPALGNQRRIFAVTCQPPVPPVPPFEMLLVCASILFAPWAVIVSKLVVIGPALSEKA